MDQLKDYLEEKYQEDLTEIEAQNYKNKLKDFIEILIKTDRQRKEEVLHD